MPITDTGYELQYTGMKFSADCFDKEGNYTPQQHEKLSVLEEFVQRFSNIGALVLRFHLAQGKRAGLIQQISRIDYKLSPIDGIAKGNDQPNLFFRAPAGGSIQHPSVMKTQIHEFAAHGTLGQTKVLNSRAQPLMHINKHAFFGEQAIWGIIHAPVWNVGRNLKYELSKQGFKYIPCPPKLNIDRAEIELALVAKEASIKTLQSFNIELETQEISRLKIHIDGEQRFTSEANGIAIQSGAQCAALGWIVHNKSGEILPLDICEDIMRVIAISGGDFYQRSKAEQAILQSGRLDNSSGEGLFTQNQAFNAMYYIFSCLEKYQFDPRNLLNKSLRTAYKAAHKKIEDNPDIIDDLLTGALLDDLVEVLSTTQGNSQREKLPIRFTNPADVNINNIRAIIHAFDLCDSKGRPLLKSEATITMKRPEHMIDYLVDGKLLYPSWNTAAHVAAVMSTVSLICEQMIVEQWLGDAIAKNDVFDSELYQLISLILKDEVQAKDLVKNLITSVKSINRSAGPEQPALGLQYEHCQNILVEIREKLALDQMSHLSALFMSPGANTAQVMQSLSETEQDELLNGLQTLMIIIKQLEQSKLIKLGDQQLHQLSSGLGSIMCKIFPSYVTGQHEDSAHVLPVSIESAKSRVSSLEYANCPFLQSKSKQDLAPQVNDNEDSHGNFTSVMTGIGHTLWQHKADIAVAAVAVACQHALG